MNVEELAAKFAKAAHESIDQRRKYCGRPYFEHPARVANLVRKHGGTPEMIAAAYLHDVVEDVPLGNIISVVVKQAPNSALVLLCSDAFPERDQKLYFLGEYFGPDIASLVEQVTDVSKLSDGNRAFRKAMDRDHLAKASAAAQTIKLADLIDNACTIPWEDDFAPVYFKEKEELLKVLTLGDSKLWHEANNLVWAFNARH